MKNWIRCLDPAGNLVVVNLNLVASYTETEAGNFLCYSGGGTQPVMAMFEDKHDTPRLAAEYHESCGGGPGEGPTIQIIHYGN